MFLETDFLACRVTSHEHLSPRCTLACHPSTRFLGAILLFSPPERGVKLPASAGPATTTTTVRGSPEEIVGGVRSEPSGNLSKDRNAAETSMTKSLLVLSCGHKSQGVPSDD